MTPAEGLLAASCLHAGFSVVVTAVVYPALAATPATGWSATHDAHSRRIGLVVAPLYVVVAAACLWVLLSPSSWSAGTLVACAGNAVAAATTALVAGPTHGRLGRSGPTPDLLGRLLAADRVRTTAAVLAAVAALLAV